MYIESKFEIYMFEKFLCNVFNLRRYCKKDTKRYYRLCIQKLTNQDNTK